MPLFRVTLEVDGMVYVEVRADDSAQAEDQAAKLVGDGEWFRVDDVERLSDE